MEFPDDILQIIKTFSQPITRPDWRTLHKFTQADLTNELILMLHVEIEPMYFVIQFKNILFIFDHYIFSVFRYVDYIEY